METTFRLEAIKILKKSKKPLRIKEITEEILKRGNVRTKGSTPNATLNVILNKEIKKKGNKSAFIKTEDRLFTLNKNYK